MKDSPPLSYRLRVLHRYLGFFLAGVMAVYAVSGIVLIYRNTEVFKREVVYHRTVAPDLDPEALARALNVKRIEFTGREGDFLLFPTGRYNPASGAATYTKQQLPVALKKLTELHRASTNSALYWFNLAFGVGLLYFVGSAFWMLAPNAPALRKGLWFSLAGMLLVLLMLLV